MALMSSGDLVANVANESTPASFKTLAILGPIPSILFNLSAAFFAAVGAFSFVSVLAAFFAAAGASSFDSAFAAFFAAGFDHFLKVLATVKASSSNIIPDPSL